MLDGAMSPAYTATKIIETGVGGINPSSSFEKKMISSFTFGFTETVGYNISASITCGLPTDQATLKEEFTASLAANQSWTKTQDQTITEAYTFNPPNPGKYECGMIVYTVEDLPLKFTAQVLVSGTNDKENVTYSGQKVQQLLDYTDFNCTITSVEGDHVIATVNGTMSATCAVKSEVYDKQISSDVE